MDARCVMQFHRENRVSNCAFRFVPESNDEGIARARKRVCEPLAVEEVHVKDAYFSAPPTNFYFGERCVCVYLVTVLVS